MPLVLPALRVPAHFTGWFRPTRLAVQADELRASRQRIVAAQDAERRRLERDLHDGAQQELVAIAMNARLARKMLGTTPAPAAGVLDEISAHVAKALDNLRDLARGVLPVPTRGSGTGAGAAGACGQKPGQGPR